MHPKRARSPPIEKNISSVSRDLRWRPVSLEKFGARGADCPACPAAVPIRADRASAEYISDEFAARIDRADKEAIGAVTIAAGQAGAYTPGDTGSYTYTHQ